MDPNAALLAILVGHLVADHAEALCDWLARKGFAPEVLMPVDKDPYFAEHCARTHGDAAGVGIRVKANHLGVWTYCATRDAWHLAAHWTQLLHFTESDC